MIRKYFPLIILSISIHCFSQTEENKYKYGFTENDSVTPYKILTEREIQRYVFSLKIDTGSRIIGGYINNIYHEPVDKAIVYLSSEENLIDSVSTDNSLFRFAVPGKYQQKNLKISIKSNDYHDFDTSIVWYFTNTIIQNIYLSPRVKILVRGRVNAHSLPLADVEVSIRHKNRIYKSTTMDCFNDKDNYWNCLFLGIFKQELTTDDSSDSIYFLLQKEGMKPLSFGMTFADYSGEILNLKMSYALKAAKYFSNDIRLEFAFPFTSSNGDWFIGLSYYKLLKIKGFKRLAAGLDANLLLTTITSTVNNPTPGMHLAKADSSYVSGFIGPSAMIWILKPDRRYFATYAGCTFAYNPTRDNLRFQPFLGTRVLIDFNKAVNLELRYMTYDLNVVDYTFNLYGDAFRRIHNKEINDLNVNIGIQVLF